MPKLVMKIQKSSDYLTNRSIVILALVKLFHYFTINKTLFFIFTYRPFLTEISHNVIMYIP